MRVPRVASLTRYLPARRLAINEAARVTVTLAADAAGTAVVLKRIPKGYPQGNFWEREIVAMEQAAGPDTAQLLAVHETDEHVTLVMPYYPDGDLFERAVRTGPLDEARACRVAVGMARALEQVARAGYQHLDVKPENFCLVGDKVVLVDFGSAEKISAVNPVTCDRGLGTEAYLPPEVSHGCISSRSDVWGVGVCTFVLLAGHHPYSLRRRRGMTVPAYPEISQSLEDAPMSPRLRAILARATQFRPNVRPSMAEVVRDLGAHAAALEHGATAPDRPGHVDARPPEMAGR